MACRLSTFAAVLAIFFAHGVRIGIACQSFLSGEAHKPLSAHAPDQRQPNLTRDLNPPGREPGSGGQRGYAHHRGLDHHLRGQPARGVEQLVRGCHTFRVHPACNFIHGVVPPHILHVDQRPIALAQNGAVDRACFEIERWGAVDLRSKRIEI